MQFEFQTDKDSVVGDLDKSDNGAPLVGCESEFGDGRGGVVKGHRDV